MDDTIREDRQKTVERIQRQQEYHRNQILKKIEDDNLKSMTLKSEKEQLMEARRAMKKQAIIQKNEINQAFEKMKLKGKMDPNVLSKLGISSQRAASAASADRSSQMAPKMLKSNQSVKEPRRRRNEPKTVNNSS
jgi:hypothetical protein